MMTNLCMTLGLFSSEKAAKENIWLIRKKLSQNAPLPSSWIPSLQGGRSS